MIELQLSQYKLEGHIAAFYSFMVTSVHGYIEEFATPPWKYAIDIS